MKDNTYMNIPEVSVAEMIDELVPLYAGALRAGIPIQSLPSVFLWGPMGVGKSQGVRQLAARLAQVTGKRVEVTDIRLLLFSPVDLRGVPVVDATRTFTDWMMPRILALDPDESIINLLFLDELSAAPQSVQAAAYQITLDHRVGEHVLPENCVVIAAGNRAGDMGVAYKQPKPLSNRLMHFAVRSEFDSWRQWAYENGVDSRIIAYLAFDRSRLCAVPEAGEYAFPTPRTWVFVDTGLKALGGAEADIAAARRLIGACVGLDTAVEFEEFCRVFRDLPAVDSIFAGRCSAYPKGQDVLYALCASLTSAVSSRRERITANELDNVCGYAARFPADFALSFFQDLSHIPGLRERLVKSEPLRAWMAKNKRYL